MSNEDLDELERRLHDALHRAVEDVQPRGDGLSRIRERVQTGRGPHWWARLRGRWLTSPGFAAAGSVGVITLGVVAAVGIGQATGIAPPLGHSTTAATSASATAPSDTSTPRPTEPSRPHTTKPTTTEPTHTQRPPETVTVPVYFVSKTSDGYGLARSSTRVTVDGSKRERQNMRAKAAYDAIFAGGRLTATGGGVWQSGTTVVDTSLSGHTLRVDLSSAAGSGGEQSADAARAALKQIVYTGLDAVPSASAVQVRVGGAPVSSFWNILSIDSGGMTKGDEALTRPLNVIEAPSSGASVTSPVTLKGTGAYAGGTVHWEIQNGQTTQSGTQDTGTSGFASWTDTVTLDPGTYTLRVYEQVDGEARNAETVTFTVTS